MMEEFCFVLYWAETVKVRLRGSEFKTEMEPCETEVEQCVKLFKWNNVYNCSSGTMCTTVQVEQCVKLFNWNNV